MEWGSTDVDGVRISDEREIRDHMPLDQIPGLRIDGILVNAGKVPPRQQLMAWLSVEAVRGNR